VLPANHFLIGLPVEAGTHTIVLTYDDPWIGYGLVGSLLGVLALLLAALVAWRAGIGRSERHKPEALSATRSG
jgi:hypothetical protein